MSVKSKSRSLVGVASLQDAKNINQTLDQNTKLKDENERIQKLFEMQQKDLQDKTLRVRVLEDALAFRSEEIGLAGHADLLAKVAQMKGELQLLKRELMEKTQTLSSVEEDRSKLSTEQETLQTQIQSILQRLAASQQEAFKYANSDLGVLLQSVERERDVLLEYIQQDMQKSSTLAKQVQHLESEIRMLRRKEQELQDKSNSFECENNEIKVKMAEQDAEIHRLTQLLRDSEQERTQVQDNLTAQKKKTDQKILEEDELMKHQVVLFAQLRGKDEELMRKSEEIIALRARNQELEIQLPPLQQEVQHLRQHSSNTDKDVVLLRKRLLELEAEHRALSATTQRLQEENKDLLHRHHTDQQDLQSLRPCKLLMEDLDRDLRRLQEDDGESNGQDDHHDPPLPPTTPDASAHHVSFGGVSSTSSSPSLSPSSPFKHLSRSQQMQSQFADDLLTDLTNVARQQHHRSTVTPTKSSKSSTSKAHLRSSLKYLTRSQEHAMWIGLPSLRRLHPSLYDRVRALAQDLHVVETDAAELQQQLSRLQQESQSDQQDSTERIQYLTQCHLQDQELLSQLKGRVHVLEGEVYALRENKAVVQQVRNVLSALSEHPLLQESATQEDLQASTHEDSKLALHPPTLLLQLHRLQQVPDGLLPELLQELLLSNVQGSVTLRDTHSRAHRLERELHDAQSLLQQSQRMNSEYSQRASTAEDQLQVKDQRLAVTESETQRQLDAAAELVEKQNALMISLEAKIESLNREKQLKTAQTTALQQREETLRHRVLQHLERDGQSLSAAQASSLSELVLLLLQIAESSGRLRPLPTTSTHQQPYDSYSHAAPHPASSSLHLPRGAYPPPPAVSSSTYSSHPPHHYHHQQQQQQAHTHSHSSHPVSHSSAHPASRDLLTAMAERELRSRAARSSSASPADIVPSATSHSSLRGGGGALGSSGGSIGGGHGQSAADALQERIRRAQESFRSSHSVR